MCAFTMGNNVALLVILSLSLVARKTFAEITVKQIQLTSENDIIYDLSARTPEGIFQFTLADNDGQQETEITGPKHTTLDAEITSLTYPDREAKQVDLIVSPTDASIRNGNRLVGFGVRGPRVRRGGGPGKGEGQKRNKTDVLKRMRNSIIQKNSGKIYKGYKKHKEKNRKKNGPGGKAGCQGKGGTKGCKSHRNGTNVTSSPVGDNNGDKIVGSGGDDRVGNSTAVNNGTHVESSVDPDDDDYSSDSDDYDSDSDSSEEKGDLTPDNAGKDKSPAKKDGGQNAGGVGQVTNPDRKGKNGNKAER